MIFHTMISRLSIIACLTVSTATVALGAKSDLVIYRTDEQFPDEGIYLKDTKSLIKQVAAKTIESSTLMVYEADPTGRCLLFAADQDADNAPELYKTDLKSAAVIPIGINCPVGSEITRIQIDNKGSNAVLSIESENPALLLLDLTTDQATTVVQVSTPEVGYAGIGLVKRDNSGKGFLYSTYSYDFDLGTSSDELWHYDLKTRNATRVAVNDQLNGFIGDAVYVSGDQSILYTSDLDSDDEHELTLYAIKAGNSVPKLQSSNAIHIDDVDAKGANVLLRFADSVGIWHEHHYGVKTDTMTTLTEDFINADQGVIDAKGKLAVVELDRGDLRSLVVYDLKKGTSSIISTITSEQRFTSYDFDLKGTGFYYTANQDEQTRRELYRKDLKTGDLSKVNDTIIDGTGIYKISVNKTGAAVYYVANKTDFFTAEVYKKDLKTGETTKVNHVLQSGEAWDLTVIGGKDIPNHYLPAF